MFWVWVSPTVANYILMTIMTVPVMIKPVFRLLQHTFSVPLWNHVRAYTSSSYYFIYSFCYSRRAVLADSCNAVRLAAVAYIVPYIFVYNTSLLLGQQPFTIGVFFTIIMAILGAIGFGTAMAGYKTADVSNRTDNTCGGSCFNYCSSCSSRIVGILVIGGILAMQFIYKKNPKHYRFLKRNLHMMLYRIFQ